MKKLTIVLLLASQLCFADTLDESYNECKSQLYVANGNGVFALSKIDAESQTYDNFDKFKTLLSNRNLLSNLKLRDELLEFKQAVVYSKGDENNKIDWLASKYHLVKQLLVEHQGTYHFFSIMNYLKNNKNNSVKPAYYKGTQTQWEEIRAKYLEVVDDEVEQFLEDMSNFDLFEDPILLDHLKHYRNDIALGNAVSAVGHSQGTLYTNFAYDVLVNENGMGSNYNVSAFGTIADRVASTKNNMRNGIDAYVLDENDDSIYLSEYLFGHLPFNAKNTNIPDNESTHIFPSYIKGNDTAPKIYTMIQNQLQENIDRPSRWSIIEESNTVGKKGTSAYRVKITNGDKTVENVLLFGRSKQDKIHYVPIKGTNKKMLIKGSCQATSIIDHTNDTPENELIINGVKVLYELEGTNPAEYITEDMDKKDCKNISMIPGGLFNAQLRWHEEDVDMSLSSSLMSQSESGCGIAAAGSGDMTLYSVYPGTYSVNVLASGYESLDHNISDLITLNVNAVGNSKKSSILVTKAYEYAHLGKDGHLADIVITRDDPTKPPVVETIPSAKINHTTYGSYPHSGGGSGSYHRSYSYYGGSSHETSSTTYSPPSLCDESCGCLPCEYDILMYLNQVRLGPISGAKVILYKATQEDDVDREILYEGSTSVSSEIDKAGVISLPVPYPEQKTLSDEEKSLMDKIAGYDGDFIIEVSGGFDIDRDDDYEVDSSFTKLNGKLHLIVDKESLLNNDYKVNILTEIAYQLSRDILGSSYDKQRVEDRLDDIAKRVFIEKLYPNSNEPIGRDDLYYWIPSAHKKWLVKSYSSYLEPIVDKVYRGDDIYDDAYKFVYEEIKNSSSQISPAPILSSKWIKVSEDIKSPAKIGKVVINSEGESSIVSYTLSGYGSELFEVDSSGDIYLKENKTLDFEKTREYHLTLVAKNSQATSRPVTLHIIVGNVVDSPEDRSFSGGVFAEDAKSGDVVGRIVFDEGTSPIERMEIGGEDKDSFDIDLNGTITISSSADFDYEKKNYAKITVQAFNHNGSSRVVPIIFTITDAIDVPIVKRLDTHISENAKALDVVGKVEILSNDPITDIRLSGYGSEDFKIDHLGEIRVNDGVSLDYERRSNYVLKVIASNIQGDSREGTVVIRIDNELDIPVLENRTYHILEYSPIGTEVGKVGIKTEGLSPISRFTLSGYGSENFIIDDSGMIRVENDMLSYFNNQYFNLNVKATNTQGESNSAVVVVYIDTQRPILGSLDTYVYENSPSQTYLGKVPLDSSPTEIISASLEGEGSENFTINNKLEIRVSDMANIDYEYRKNYNLTVKATNSAGESNRQNVYIRVIDRDDTIKISGFATTIYEDAKGGDTIGFIKVITTGGYTIDHYILSGDRSENFIVEDSGVVRVSSSAIFDRINHPNYHLELIAEDINGVKSDRVYLDIRVIKSINTPVAKSQNITLDEDSSKAIELKATDKDGDPLTYIITTPPTHGQFKGGIYTPNANYYGSDSFTFKANDGKFDSDLATVSITINPVNDAPIANDQNITLDEDNTKEVRLIGTDVDGDSLTYNIVTLPTHGVYKDGKYTPNANYFGKDKIIYKANDGKIDSDLATIDITIKPVNDAPVAKAQSITIDEDNSTEIKLSGFDIEGDKLTYKIVSSPLHGVIKNGVYTPKQDYYGSDSFRFVANDGKLDSKSEIVTITINPINDRPIGNSMYVFFDNYMYVFLEEDTNKSILFATDVDNDDLTYEIIIPPSHGVYKDGIYTPNVNYFGEDKIACIANDGKLDSDLITITIVILPVNDRPIAYPNSMKIEQGLSKYINFKATDIENDKLSFIIVSSPSHGVIKNGIYTPDRDYFGTDSFTFKAFDGDKYSNVETINIEINKNNNTSITIPDIFLTVPKYYRTLKNIGTIDIDFSNIDKLWIDKQYIFNTEEKQDPPFDITIGSTNIYITEYLEKGEYELKLFALYKSGVVKSGKIFIDNPYNIVKRDVNITIDSNQTKDTKSYIGSIITLPIQYHNSVHYVWQPFDQMINSLKGLDINNIAIIPLDNNRLYLYLKKPLNKVKPGKYSYNCSIYNGDGDGIALHVQLNIKENLDKVEGFTTIVKNHSTFETKVNDNRFEYSNVIGKVRIQFPQEDIDDIFLVGEGSEDFIIYKDGYVVVADGVTLEHDIQSNYNLKVIVWEKNNRYEAPIEIEVLNN